MVSALYDAVVTHVRREPRRAFTHRLCLWLVDVDDLPVLPRWLRPFAAFRARDHVENPGRSIRADLEDWLAARGIRLAGGRVLMLTQAAVLGHVFNPLSLYWCHDADGELVCVVAQVHNTYRGRHRYLLRPDAAGRAEADKTFYVSPFLAVRGRYRLRVPEPDARLDVSVVLDQDGRVALAAGLRGRRRPATTTELVRLLLTRPLIPQRVSALIRAHGIALWLRRLPLFSRDQEAA
ncbi:DUF1365 domain-containing protein [Saccharomonospora piscinae]|uniref:DUF1365 domain-containing protein n=1 Tax=Saccharomonospora piscinae TaxID=687388 RepID=UPI00046327F8|nr:DUF1365 domain-containing protein [Saccharomonospora piscinae]